jgi:hypothetical protein
MQRTDFILKSGLLAAMGLLAPAANGLSNQTQNTEDLKPVLLPPLPPLEHNGGG